MFVDASAIVAILTREPEAEALADVLDAARLRITSPIAFFEAALGICRKRNPSVTEAEEDVRESFGSGQNRIDRNDGKGSRDGALGVFSLWKKALSSCTTQSRSLLCVRCRQNQRRALLFKDKRFRQDRHPGSNQNIVEVARYLTPSCFLTQSNRVFA